MALNPNNSPSKGKSATDVTSVTPTTHIQDSIKGAEETEIVHVPEDGGWGWVVVAAAFCTTFILDGIALTFGSIRPDMSLDLGTSETIVALINSIALALYLITGPLISALINRFGFRACAMVGSILCSVSLFVSYFLHNVGALILFYGVFCGMGFALINMSAGLVVGFYFEKRRAIAIGISTIGTSAGIMFWYPVNSQLVALAGWRSVTLFHSGMFGMIYFLVMTFRPLLLLNVTTTEATADMVNTNDEPQVLKTQPGPSNQTAHASKITITPMTPKSGISNRHLQKVKSIISKTNMTDIKTQNLKVTVPERKPKHVSCWGRLCCHWERHVSQSRPMDRDDAFYDGKVQRLSAYQRSKGAAADDEQTGLEYRLAVSHTTATRDLQERRGVCTTALWRVLAAMIDTQLLKLSTFKYLCAGSFLIYLGFLIPFAYIEIRNVRAGIDPQHCSLFVSAMGGCNGLGRLGYGLLATKFCPIKLSVIGLCVGGISTALSHISFNIYFQYIYSSLFGSSVACVCSLRALMLVKLYGLEKLTKATGMLFLFQGIGGLLSTPLANVLNEHFGYTIGFLFSGISLTLGGLLLARMNCVFLKEKGVGPPIGTLAKSKVTNQLVIGKK